jgi:hypothetical protein
MMTAAMATMATVEAATITHPSFSRDLLVKNLAASAHVGPMIRFKHRAVDDQWFVTAISPAMPAA